MDDLSFGLCNLFFNTVLGSALERISGCVSQFYFLLSACSLAFILSCVFWSVFSH